MATTGVDLNSMISNFGNTLINSLGKLIGSGGVSKVVTGSTGANVGNAGGVLPINLNWGTIAIIGGGIIVIVLLVKKI